jgi:hypothetical protein
MQKCPVSGGSKKRAEFTKSPKGQKCVASIFGSVCPPSSVPHVTLALVLILLGDLPSRSISTAVTDCSGEFELFIIPLSISDLGIRSQVETSPWAFGPSEGQISTVSYVNSSMVVELVS